MKKNFLTVVGIGEDGLDGLAPTTRKLIEKADILVGGLRHLSKVSIGNELRIDWSNGIEKVLNTIEKHRKKS